MFLEAWNADFWTLRVLICCFWFSKQGTDLFWCSFCFCVCVFSCTLFLQRSRYIQSIVSLRPKELTLTSGMLMCFWCVFLGFLVSFSVCSYLSTQSKEEFTSKTWENLVCSFILQNVHWCYVQCKQVTAVGCMWVVFVLFCLFAFCSYSLPWL